MNDTINETINNSIINASNQITNSSIFSNYINQSSLPFLGNPTYDIFVISLFVALFTTLLNKYLTDQKKIKSLRSEMKKMQKEIREHIKKNNHKKAQEIQKKMMKHNIESIKHTMNPKVMLITILPLLIVFSFIRTYYAHFGEFLNLGFTEFGWLGTYILFSIINSIILKKVLDVA